MAHEGFRGDPRVNETMQGLGVRESSSGKGDLASLACFLYTSRE